MIELLTALRIVYGSTAGGGLELWTDTILISMTESPDSKCETDHPSTAASRDS